MKHQIKKILTLAILFIQYQVYAQDFSAISPSGHTLYYLIVNDGVFVIQ